MSDAQEIVQRLEREMADSAVRTLDDHDSEIDAQIATAIDEHLRAIDMLCHFGIDGGFGKKHPIKEY